MPLEHCTAAKLLMFRVSTLPSMRIPTAEVLVEVPTALTSTLVMFRTSDRLDASPIHAMQAVPVAALIQMLSSVQTLAFLTWIPLNGLVTTRSRKVVRLALLTLMVLPPVMPEALILRFVSPPPCAPPPKVKTSKFPLGLNVGLPRLLP